MGLKLTQLASKPQLIKITLDTKEIQEKYGDSLEFWILDRQPIDQFIKMADTFDVLLFKCNTYGGKLTRFYTGSEFGNQILM